MRDDRAVTTTEPITQPSRPRSAAGRRLDELAFLHEIARLTTQARDWDELMRTIVDGTTAAMGVEVCSFYLSDRDADRLTLAATNGLDRSQVGRVSLAVGQGITGRAAASRLPIAVRDVTADRRFSWVRGFDMRGLHAMLSVPLVWQDEVVGVLNVQTLAKRNFRRAEIEFLTTIAALLAGIVAKGRLQAEIEGRLQQLTALDAARAELLSVVTHELRTPLSVVRAYVDLLGEAAAGTTPGPDGASAREWHDAALDQVSRLDRLVDSILASVRGEGLTGLSRAPFDAVAAVGETVDTLGLSSVRTRSAGSRRPRGWSRSATTRASARSWSSCSRTIEVRADGRRREHRRVAASRRDPGVCHRRRPRRPGGGLGERLRAVRPDRGTGRSRGSGIGLFAARRLMDAMGGRVWLEPNGYGGAGSSWRCQPRAERADQVAGTGAGSPCSSATRRPSSASRR